MYRNFKPLQYLMKKMILLYWIQSKLHLINYGLVYWVHILLTWLF